MEQLLRDTHAALRFLIRNPSFSVVVVGTIAMAICINATVFAAVNAALLRPLPFADPERLVQIVAIHSSEIGAGLMVRTVVNLRQTDLGFQPSQLFNVYLRPGLGVSRQGPDMAVFYQTLRERLSRLPGVRRVGAAKGLPLVSDVASFDVEVSTDAMRADGRRAITARSWFVVPGYFEALGVPLLKGRYFEPADDIGAKNVAIINAGLARRAFGEQDATGRQLMIPSRQQDVTVVGVVGDIRTSPGEPAADIVYLTGTNTSARLTINFVIAVDDDVAGMASRIRDEILAVERNVAVLDISSLEDAFEQTVGYPRFLSGLLNAFGAIGLLLAAMGVYGLGSFTVAHRRREMGVRIAIGANRRSIIALVVGSGVRAAALGAVLGIGLAFVMMRYLSGALYGVASTDPLTLGTTAVILLATSVCASYVPAHRASRIDPSELIRSE